MKCIGQFFFLNAAAPSSKPQFRRGLNRIVGGTEATAGELPYQLSFQDLSFGGSFHFCGASIYNENWAICAAHCVQGEDMDNPDYLRVHIIIPTSYATEKYEYSMKHHNQITFDSEINIYAYAHDGILHFRLLQVTST